MELSKSMYTVVSPVCNEEETIGEFLRRLVEVMEGLDHPYEIVLINDGSTDQSMEMMAREREENPRIKIVDFARNFGHQTAISAGIQFSSGDVVVVMDSDLQDPPQVVPKLIDKLDEGNDVVYAVRRKRKENVLKKAAYYAFYRMLSRVSDIDIPLDSGDFCAMRRPVVDLLRSMPERNRFVRGLRSWVGFQQTGLEYERDRRYAGEVKYTFSKLARLAMDGMLSFSYFPLRISVTVGLVFLSTGFLGLLVLVLLRLITGMPPETWLWVAILVILVGGVQCLLFGAMGEYLGRIYDEVRQRPLFTVRRMIGFSETDVD